jgi:hypothetical protein
VERWRDAVDRDRDLVATLIAEHGSSPMLQALLDELDKERVRVRALHARLWAEREDPVLIFSVRPRRALKASLRPRASRRMA